MDLDQVATDLRRLSGVLRTLRPQAQAHGLLGGVDGYGQHFENEVFEMHPYYWGDCTCGYDERRDAWEESHHHAPDCYQTALQVLRAEHARALGCSAPSPRTMDEVAANFLGHFVEVDMGETSPGVRVGVLVPRPPRLSEADYLKANAVYAASVEVLCKARGLSYPDGSEAHCTCAWRAEFEAYLRADDCDPKCPLAIPNFRHKASGLTVDWYKYIGRGMSASRAIDQAEWAHLFAECMASIAADSA